MDKYTELYNNMEPGIIQCAAAWGISAATLGAMAKRGLVEVFDGKPKKYKRADGSLYKQIYDLVTQSETEYFGLFKRDEELGMLCRIKDGRIVDAWDKPYDITNVLEIRINQNKISLTNSN